MATSSSRHDIVTTGPPTPPRSAVTPPTVLTPPVWQRERFISVTNPERITFIFTSSIYVELYYIAL